MAEAGHDIRPMLSPNRGTTIFPPMGATQVTVAVSRHIPVRCGKIAHAR